MPKQADKKDPTLKKRPAAGAAPTGHDTAEHVPEEAENFEHTIRRLTIEKQKKRDKASGLYR